MTKHAAAYIRRSSDSADSPGDASRENQRRACQALAAMHCPDLEVREYGRDWGVSGRNDDRKDYQKLRAAIAAGQVCAVVTYSLSRLGRTSRELIDFFEFCDAHDVPAFSQAEGQLTPAKGAHATFIRAVLIQMAQLESDLAKERVRAIINLKQERGDVMGQPRYGFRRVRDADGRYVLVEDPDRPFAPIRQAMQEAGSVLGAARLLEERGIPAPKGGRRWSPSALTRVVDAHAPGLLPKKTLRGRRVKVTSALAQLLRCHCGEAMLTPNPTRGQFTCYVGHHVGSKVHGKTTATERFILPWIKEEVARAGAAIIRYVPADDTAARRQAIEGRLARAGELFMAGDITKQQFAAEKARAERALQDLPEADDVLARDPRIGPLVDWDGEPAEINRQLRAVFREIQLDADMRPVSATWRRPEWRRTA